MRKTITTEKIPIQLWLDALEPEPLQQAKNLANLPFAHHHIAIMPDAHMGYGMPIGGVAATMDVVIPNAVGVDIGCGVGVIQSSLKTLTPAGIKEIFAGIRAKIPLGAKHHKHPRSSSSMPPFANERGQKKYPVIAQEFKNGQRQLGTLGGGNHFIEIQRGDDGYIYFMVHSGSRNIGYTVASHYNSLAKERAKSRKDKIPARWQLDYLELDSENGQCYLREMNYCVAFAEANRALMLQTIKDITVKLYPDIDFSETIDIAHNFAAQEYHFGKEVVVHRKGATRAEKGQLGIIPGSQGSASFIVRGRGNQESFCSCSHGAGRKLGRKQAQRSLDLKEEMTRLNQQHIVHSIRHKKDLDEAAGAYKDIMAVMNYQTDLVEIVTRLNPLGVIKG